MLDAVIRSSIRSECDNEGTELVCNDDDGQSLNSIVNVDRAEPGTYYIFADTFNEGTTFDVSIQVAPIGPECELDDDCDGLTICEQNFCVEPSCVRDSQCADDERCQSGRCVQRADFLSP